MTSDGRIAAMGVHTLSLSKATEGQNGHERLVAVYADSLTHWDFARFTPDLVIVALGTNDFSDGAGPISVGDALVSRFSYEGHFAAGCDGHPDLAEQRTMADQLEPAVRKLMGW